MVTTLVTSTKLSYIEPG